MCNRAVAECRSREGGVSIKGRADSTQPVCPRAAAHSVCSWGSSTWELVRHANSWAPPQTCWIRNSAFWAL